MENETLRVKSKRFSVRVIRMYKYLCEEKREYVLSKQVLRSGTSIGANIAESAYAISRKDFLSKIYIALKECAETIYWLELLYETDYISEAEYRSNRSDCNDMFFMLQATTKTMTSRLKRVEKQ